MIFCTTVHLIEIQQKYLQERKKKSNSVTSSRMYTVNVTMFLQVAGKDQASTRYKVLQSTLILFRKNILQYCCRMLRHWLTFPEEFRFFSCIQSDDSTSVLKKEKITILAYDGLFINTRTHQNSIYQLALANLKWKLQVALYKLSINTGSMHCNIVKFHTKISDWL